MADKVVNHELNIDLPVEIAEGHYANLAIISHSTSEFVIDFAAMLPGVQKAKVRTRVVLTPEHAKRLLMSLQENITRYETNIGRITIPTPKGSEEVAMSFGVGKA